MSLDYLLHCLHSFDPQTHNQRASKNVLFASLSTVQLGRLKLTDKSIMFGITNL